VAIPASSLKILWKTFSQSMNTIARSILRRAAPAVACVLLAASSLTAAEPAGAIDFGAIPGPSGDGEQVEVHLPRNLISIATRIVAKQEPEVAKLLESIDSVRVRVVSLDEGNRAAVQKRMGEVRADLAKSGWQKIVTAKDSGGDDVAIFMRTKGDEVIEGVAVTVLGGESEAVFVNVVGSIRPEQIAEIAEALHVPHLATLTAAVAK
jgi:hypothetical protein